MLYHLATRFKGSAERRDMVLGYICSKKIASEPQLSGRWCARVVIGKECHCMLCTCISHIKVTNLASPVLNARHLSGSAFCKFCRLGVPEQALGGIPLRFGIAVEDKINLLTSIHHAFKHTMSFFVLCILGVSQTMLLFCFLVKKWVNGYVHVQVVVVNCHDSVACCRTEVASHVQWVYSLSSVVPVHTCAIV